MPRNNRPPNVPAWVDHHFPRAFERRHRRVVGRYQRRIRNYYISDRSLQRHRKDTVTLICILAVLYCIYLLSNKIAPTVPVHARRLTFWFCMITFTTLFYLICALDYQSESLRMAINYAWKELITYHMRYVMRLSSGL